MRVKSQSQVDAAYRAGIPKAAAKYKDGVAATNNWQEQAIKGESNYATKVSEAVANGTRAKALASVSNEEWKNAAINKGAARIGPGMEQGADKRSRNFEPYRTALEAKSLPARSTDAMTNIDNRLKATVQVMLDTKKAQLGR